MHKFVFYLFLLTYVELHTDQFLVQVKSTGRIYVDNWKTVLCVSGIVDSFVIFE